METCFLCKPDTNLVYAESDQFFAMLGHGPIVEGYSLIATIDHFPSMLDLELQDVELLMEFVASIRSKLRPLYGDVIITEHGRVSPCKQRDASRSWHCFHAHMLVFPIDLDLSKSLISADLEVFEYKNFADCHAASTWDSEYLYFERPDGSCVVAPTPNVIYRQFFRYAVAQQVGHPEYANWALFKRMEIVNLAQTKLISK